MIGIGFALTGTLVLDRGIDERAFEHVLTEIAHEYARPIERGARSGYLVPGVEFGLNDPESLRLPT